MAQVLNQDSTYGSPNVNYKLDLTYSGRTASSITISYTLTATLLYSSSWIGNGYGLKAYIYAGNNYTSHVLVSEWNDTWEYSDGSRKLTGSFTVSGLSGSTSSIATALYVEAVNGYSDPGGQLNKTSGSALSIPTATVYTVTYYANGGSDAPASQSYYYGGGNFNLRPETPTRSGYNFLGWSTSSTATSPSYYPSQEWSSWNGSTNLYAVWELANGKSSFFLSNNTIDLDNLVSMYINQVSSSNTHTIVLALPTGSYTLATGVGASHTFTLPASTWAKLFTDSKSVNGTITVTTYSGSTSLGSVSQGVILRLPENIGKPDKPTVVLSSEHAASATIDLKKPTFKHGADFKEWQVETNIGKAKVIGNRVHIGVDPAINKTGVVTVRAVDSRGFMSDPVNVQWHKRKTGGCVFMNGMWR